MSKYAILANPGHNRIYFDTALKIAVSELQAIADAYDMEIKEIGEGNLGLPASICFSTNKNDHSPCIENPGVTNDVITNTMATKTNLPIHFNMLPSLFCFL